MNTRTVIWLATLLLLAPTFALADGFLQHVVWRSASLKEPMHAIFIHDQSPTATVERVLLKGPQGRRAVFTNTLSADAGKMTYRFLSDETGWWIEYVCDFSFTAESVQDFYAHLLGDKRLDGEPTFTIAVSTSKGSSYRETRPFCGTGFNELMEDFSRWLQSSPLAENLAAEVPGEAAEISMLLDAMMHPGPGSGDHGSVAAYSPLFGAVADVLRAADFSDKWAGVRWSHETTRGEIGPGWTSDPEALEFVSLFKSVDNVDILAGERAADLDRKMRSDEP
jgi:hypothetical protein